MSVLKRTLKALPRHPQLARYLIARMIFTDGINTLFAAGGVYASGTFGMSVAEVIMFGLVLNATAGAGAFAFGWIDDWIGAKPTILIGLVAITAIGVPLLLIESKLWFWILGGALGIFFRSSAVGEPLDDGSYDTGRHGERNVWTVRLVRQSNIVGRTAADYRSCADFR